MSRRHRGQPLDLAELRRRGEARYRSDIFITRILIFGAAPITFVVLGGAREFFNLPVPWALATGAPTAILLYALIARGWAKFMWRQRLRYLTMSEQSTP